MERETQILERLLNAEPLAPASARGMDDAEQTLERLYVELMGLIPHAVEPIVPDPKAKARLMARIAAGADEGRREAELPLEELPFAEAPAPGARSSEPVAGAVEPTGAEPAASPARRPRSQGVRPPARPPIRPPIRQPNRWPLALAALLAFAMVGLSALLYARLDESQLRAARLERELDRVAGEQGSLNEARGRMASLSEKFELITAPGTEICPLRPPSQGRAVPGSETATGVLFTRDGRWWLKISGLAPPPNEQAYQVWFVTDVGPISGGILTAESESGALEIGSPTMPTGMQAVQVTLEPAGGTDLPTGPTVLYGDERMTIL